MASAIGCLQHSGAVSKEKLSLMYGLSFPTYLLVLNTSLPIMFWLPIIQLYCLLVHFTAQSMGVVYRNEIIAFAFFSSFFHCYFMDISVLTFGLASRVLGICGRSVRYDIGITFEIQRNIIISICPFRFIDRERSILVSMHLSTSSTELSIWTLAHMWLASQPLH